MCCGRDDTCGGFKTWFDSREFLQKWQLPYLSVQDAAWADSLYDRVAGR